MRFYRRVHLSHFLNIPGTPSAAAAHHPGPGFGRASADVFGHLRGQPFYIHHPPYQPHLYFGRCRVFCLAFVETKDRIISMTNIVK